MDKTETYLWGTLLALVREQQIAQQEYVKGDLGMFGRMRMSSRNRAIAKMLMKLLAHKTKVHGSDAGSSLTRDFEVFESKQKPWEDITPEEISYVKLILAECLA